MVRTIATFSALAVMLSLRGVAAQDTESGDLLRYQFEEGEKFQWSSTYKMVVEIEEMPEEFEGLFPDPAIEIDIKMELNTKVTEVKEDEVTLEARFRKLSAEGVILFQEIEFQYDADENEGEEEEDEEGFGGGFGMDIEDRLRKLVRNPFKLTIDKLGRIRLQGRGMRRAGRGLAAQFMSLNGFMGLLPKKRVEQGDTWKSSQPFGVPNLPIRFKIHAKNKYAEKDRDGNAVIQSTYSVKKKAEEDDEGGMPFQLDATMTGKGEGTTTFDLENGRLASSKHKIVVDIEANLEDPTTGDDMVIKAKLTLNQKTKLEKQEE